MTIHMYNNLWYRTLWRVTRAVHFYPINERSPQNKQNIEVLLTRRGHCTIILRSMSTWPVIIWKQSNNVAGVPHKEGVICTTIPGAIVQRSVFASSYGQSSIRFISFTLHVHLPFKFYQLASSNNFSLHFTPSSFGAAAKYLQKRSIAAVKGDSYMRHHNEALPWQCLYPLPST